MFAKPAHKKTKAPAQAKLKAKAPAGMASPEQNPLWQSLALHAPVQRKLAVGQPNDPDEREADRVAEQVLRMATPLAGNLPPSFAVSASPESRLSSVPTASMTAQSSGLTSSTKASIASPNTPAAINPTTGLPQPGKSKASDSAIAVRNLQRKRVHPEEEARLQRPVKRATPESVKAIPATVRATLSSAGQPLGASTRSFMEPRFGHNFSDVRLHTGGQAEASAERINARAYTLGRHIVFGAGQYSPASNDGRWLLAHELTHVVQQTGEVGDSPAAAPVAIALSPKNLIQRAGGPLDQRLEQEYEFWRAEAESFEGDETKRAEFAVSSRILLLFQGIDGDSFADETELQAFIDEAIRDAGNEDKTFERTGEWALRATNIFPHIWSDRVHDALYLDVNMGALREERAQKRLAMQVVADRIPRAIGEFGLPVPYAEALALTEFHLQLRHLNLDRQHVVKDMAIAAREYGVVGWKTGFYTMWNAMVDSFADTVAAGEIVVNYTDYTEFVETRRQGLEALGTRLGSVNTRELMEAFDNDVTALTHVALLVSVASALLGLAPAVMYWNEGTQLFDEKLMEVDVLIAGESGADKVLRAFRWAYDAGYFGAAAEQIMNGILSHGWQILGVAAAFIIAQYIPFLNVAVDAAVIIYSGVDALRALNALYESFAAVGNSGSAIALQSNSARMAASLEGDGLRLLMDLLALGAATRGIRTRADVLRRTGLSEEEALRQALREATGAEAAALRGAAARQRIRTRFDPDGLLDALLDRGINPEVVEQALMSGMTPQRLNRLVAAVSDVTRAQAIIEYAGRYSSPINALVDAGVPVARVGDMMDLGLGLRELSACDIVLTRTGGVAQVEGLITALGRFGAAGTAQLIRLTPRGLASVFLAGGEAAMRTILDTLALEGPGLIVGFDDWVYFTISRMNKQGADLLNSIGELREAQRVAQTLGAGQRVRIGGDARVPVGTKSFDMAVEDAAGNTLRNIEVRTLAGSGAAPATLNTFRDLTAGINHGIDKITSGTQGAAEVTIRVTVRASTSLGRGRRRLMNPDGTYRIVEADGRTSPPGSVLQDTINNLPRIPRSGELSQVHVVNMDGSLVGSIRNSGGTWTVVP